jgi:hypothetical protein
VVFLLLLDDLGVCFNGYRACISLAESSVVRGCMHLMRQGVNPIFFLPHFDFQFLFLLSLYLEFARC